MRDLRCVFIYYLYAATVSARLESVDHLFYGRKQIDLREHISEGAFADASGVDDVLDGPGNTHDSGGNLGGHLHGLERPLELGQGCAELVFDEGDRVAFELEELALMIPGLPKR